MSLNLAQVGQTLWPVLCPPSSSESHPAIAIEEACLPGQCAGSP